MTANAKLRMQLQIALASAIIHTFGPAEQAKTILTEALESADTLNDIGAQMRALSAWGTCMFFAENTVRPGL